jgi:hypothetical protein
MHLVWMRDDVQSCELLHTDPAVYEKKNKALGPIARMRFFWSLLLQWLPRHQAAYEKRAPGKAGPVGLPQISAVGLGYQCSALSSTSACLR